MLARSIQEPSIVVTEQPERPKLVSAKKKCPALALLPWFLKQLSIGVLFYLLALLPPRPQFLGPGQHFLGLWSVQCREIRGVHAIAGCPFSFIAQTKAKVSTPGCAANAICCIGCSWSPIARNCASQIATLGSMLGRQRKVRPAQVDKASRFTSQESCNVSAFSERLIPCHS